MQWEQEAIEIIEALPLPPVMAPLAKLDAQRRALHEGCGVVTPDIARAVARGYERTFGSEAFAMMKRMAAGEPVDLPDEFFMDDSEELFKIEICPVKYGACTEEKRRMVQQIVAPLRAKLTELEATRIIMMKARTPLMSHHVFRVAVIGCPNCCLSPYFSDFGVICTFAPKAEPSGCVQCQACVRYCTEGAIALDQGNPVIDDSRCVRCGGCVRECPKDVFSIAQSSYTVVVGGCGSRHPRIAQTVAEETDAAGVLGILERALTLYRDYPEEDREVSFHEFICKAGTGILTGSR